LTRRDEVLLGYVNQKVFMMFNCKDSSNSDYSWGNSNW
jgi:hypothetical protein